MSIARNSLVLGTLLCALVVRGADVPADSNTLQKRFRDQVQPFLKAHCFTCHNVDKMKSGIRVDHLDGSRPERSLRLWEAMRELIADHEMPPEDEPQPSPAERARVVAWIEDGLHEARSRDVARDGVVRRLTVAQYRNTLRELLGLEDDLTAYLPPEAVSRDGFVNNKDTMILSPLLLETYFDIASQALDLCLVDEDSPPVIQNFRMDFGRGINPDPLPEKLILGASSKLLPNPDFRVVELTPRKPFLFEPFEMQTQFRFVEGYQGNSTVRGWREYDSIYHAVYACMRGSYGYPLGNPYDLVPEGLLLRPAIPSAELFQVESTYGPKANFKVALRELPDHGRFRVTVRAAKYDDGLMLDQGRAVIGEGIVIERPGDGAKTIEVDRDGVYQVEVNRVPPPSTVVVRDDTQLDVELSGAWDFDSGKAESPFGRAIWIGEPDHVIVSPWEDTQSVGQGDFTISAWIHPTSNRSGGILATGETSRRGWILDYLGQQGGLRLQTHRDYQQSSGSLETKPGVIRSTQWQHVAAVVQRGKNKARLFVNGFEVATGSIAPHDLSNPDGSLSIGGIPKGDHFHGMIDGVRIYRRALRGEELQALIEPGREFVMPPPDGRQPLTVRLNDREFAGTLIDTPFLWVRLPKGPLTVEVDYGGTWQVENVVLAPLSDVGEFERFESRSPLLGVHFGLRRDCGHTLNPVGPARAVSSVGLEEFVFEGAINNFPSPDVEKDNVNYISGLREIGVRSEYTDGRARPRLLIRSVEFEGPLYETWPPKTHRRIFTSEEPQSVIRDFATRAFRRPITEDEERSVVEIYQNALVDRGNRKDALKDVLSVVLTSPQFLFLIEESASPESEPVSQYELAAKLAYFLWNEPPDRQLLDLAARGLLQESLDTEIDRLVEDARFGVFANEFVTQWLGLEKLETVETDRERFPRLTRDTKTQLRKEPVAFIQYLLRENLPLRNLIISDFVVANEVVAAYYGLEDRVESGFEFRPIEHGDSQLGGLLTQAGILAALTDGREANPVKRGAWFARKIIAEPPADPPPNVPDLSVDFEHLSLREQLERHRNQEGCAKCHEGIDPWGLPFEQFDAGGRFMKGESVDASSVLPDKTSVNGLQDLKDYLVEERLDQVAFSFLRHLATYAVGRDLSYNEVEFLRQSTVELEDTPYRMRDLLRFVIHSDLFLKK